jgi:hypothetical protein
MVNSVKMTVWLEQTFPYDGWSHVQEAFEKQFDAFDGPRDMMVVKVANPTQKICHLIVALPHAALGNAYEGFSAISPEQLPDRAALVVGHQVFSTTCSIRWNRRQRGREKRTTPAPY